MKHYNRGSSIVVETAFYDSSGDIAEPSSATISFSYLDAADTSTDILGVSTFTNFEMTGPSTAGVFSSTFHSCCASPGMVRWEAYPSDTLLSASRGTFMLRASPANFVTCVPEAAVEAPALLLRDGSSFLLLRDGSRLELAH
jgi:hypothetical protein